MNELTKDFLTKIGVSNDTISAISTDEPAEDLNVDDLVKGFVTNQKSLSANDPELIKKIRDEVRGTELSKMEHKIKKAFALSAEDMREKKFEEILDVASDKIRKEAGSTSEELQQKILELNKSIKNYEEEILPAERNKANQEIKRFRRDLALRDVLSKKNLIVGSEVILPALNKHLNDFVVELDESDQLTIKTKDGLKPLNSDGTKALTFEEIIDGQLSSMNVVKQSNGDPAQTGTTEAKTTTGTPDPGAEVKFNLRGMEKANQNAKNLAEMRRHGLPR